MARAPTRGLEIFDRVSGADSFASGLSYGMLTGKGRTSNYAHGRRHLGQGGAFVKAGAFALVVGTELVNMQALPDGQLTEPARQFLQVTGKRI